MITSDSIILYNIAPPIVPRKDCDVGRNVLKSIYNSMRVVDILPLKMEKVTKFTIDIGHFKENCMALGLGAHYAGIRIYCNSDSAYQDDFSISYENNYFENYSFLSHDTIKKLRDLTMSSGTAHPFMKDVVKMAAGGISKAVDKVSSFALQNITNKNPEEKERFDRAIKAVRDASQEAINFIGQTVTDFFTSNYRISLPKIFSAASYTNSLQLAAKIITPYGHPFFVTKYVIVPYLYLLAMFSPRLNLLNTRVNEWKKNIKKALEEYNKNPTKRNNLKVLFYRIMEAFAEMYSMTYGARVGEMYYAVRAYGVADLPIAIFNGISVRRGGNDHAYNKFNQPLALDVSLSFTSAIEGFGLNTDRHSQINFRKMVNGVLPEEEYQYDLNLPSGSDMIPGPVNVAKSLMPYHPAPMPDRNMMGERAVRTSEHVGSVRMLRPGAPSGAATAYMRGFSRLMKK